MNKICIFRNYWAILGCVVVLGFDVVFIVGAILTGMKIEVPGVFGFVFYNVLFLGSLRFPGVFFYRIIIDRDKLTVASMKHQVSFKTEDLVKVDYVRATCMPEEFRDWVFFKTPVFYFQDRVYTAPFYISGYNALVKTLGPSISTK